MTFSDKMRDVFNKSLAASREALSKAGAQAQTWGEMGVLKVEIIQYRSQAEKLVAQLGTEVYEVLAEKGQKTISAESPAVRDLLARIRDTEKAIQEREERFQRLGGKEADLDQAKP